MIRLVIVEDDPAMLEALGRLFNTAEGIRLVGAYETAEAALQEVDWQEVDVLLTDLDLPGLTGPQLIAVARGQAPQLLALAHTVHEQRESLFQALRAGASGYLVKGMLAPALVQAIRAIFGGETPLSPMVAKHLIAQFHETEAAASGAPQEDLTSREREVLRCFIRGSTYDEIADAMGISRHTVHTHIRNIYGKLHVNSRKQALRQALSRGYL
jgi:DNA-binding NarL/FixJ family response regulator